ncbi:MAG: glycosyltransferase family 4 protein [Gillisia sp.]
MIFSVFTHVVHKLGNSKYFAYGPYVREMNIWFKNFEKVTIIAPSSEENVFENEEAYKKPSVSFKEISSFNLLSVKQSLNTIIRIPGVVLQIIKGMKQADHLHLRCPGNIGLLAAIIQIFFPKKPKTAKYAGNWDPGAKQPWSYRFQKWILSNTFLTRNMQVLVYGQWPGQSKNIVPFFTASFSEEEIPEIVEKDFTSDLTFLYVGNLVQGKQPLEAIKLVEKLKTAGKMDKDSEDQIRQIRLEIYGSGPERENLESYCREKDWVRFQGACSIAELKKAYQKAHFIILLSKSEGWPKALAEGMFYGCIPIATPVSCVPWMLGKGSRGVLVMEGVQAKDLPGNGSGKGISQYVSGETGQSIVELIKDPEGLSRMSDDAKEWSQQYTLEKLESAIKQVLKLSNQKNPFSLGK